LAEVLFMVIFALLKGNTKFKEIFGWMIYNKENLPMTLKPATHRVCIRPLSKRIFSITVF